MRRDVPLPVVLAFWILCSSVGCVVGNLATMYVVTQVVDKAAERAIDRAVDKAVGRFAPRLIEGK